MRILYGVQGTGNGHLSRARAMARHFARRGAEVTYLFSGRPREQFFDMEAFGDFLVCRGLTFSTRNGSVSYWRTALNNSVLQFLRDVVMLDLAPYDVVLSDFEPVTAWAGQWRGKRVISIGNQSAFRHNIPVSGGNAVARAVLRHFAPADVHVGLHWHHFGQTILPPIIDVADDGAPPAANKVLVYLPFENPSALALKLQPFTSHAFYIYGAGHAVADEGHLHWRPLSVAGFRQDLKSAAAVICNAGFELPSECLQLGKKLLVKPLQQQMEQLSNALALERLGFATVMQDMDSDMIRRWLASPNHNVPMQYPDVAEALVDWILSGSVDAPERLVSRLWQDTALA